MSRRSMPANAMRAYAHVTFLTSAVVAGRAGVNYTRFNYNYNCNYLVSANYNYNYSSLGPITNTITFYQLQLQLL